MCNRLLVFVVAGLLPLVGLAETRQTRSSNPDTGAETWNTRSSGVSFSLTQLLPDQVRAFYVNRGFTLEQIDHYVAACIYTTILRNDKASGVVHFVLQDWSVVSDTGSAPPMSTGNWLQRLQQAGATKPALIAFRWAQFPPEHKYEPNGDWNQGMLAIDLPAGSSFDLVARWDVDGKSFEEVLRGVRCAQ